MLLTADGAAFCEMGFRASPPSSTLEGESTVENGDGPAEPKTFGVSVGTGYDCGFDGGDGGVALLLLLADSPIIPT